MGMHMGHLVLVERYLPLVTPAQSAEIAARLERAERALARRGSDVRWLHSLVLPRDEAWLCLFAASDINDVLELNRIAEVTCDALLEVQLIRPERATPPRVGHNDAE